jgi:O-antigen ligase
MQLIKKNNTIKFQTFTLCLYFFSIHFESWDPFETGIDFLVTKITIVLYLIACIPNFKRFRYLKSYTKFIKPILLIFTISTISGFLNQRPFYSEYFSMVFFLNILMFLLMLIHFQRDRIAIINALKYFAFGGIFLTLFFVLGIETDNSFGVGRLTVFDVNHNMLAVNMSIVFIIIFYHLIYVKDNYKIVTTIYVIFIPIIIVFIASTGSRSGVLTLITAVLLLFLLSTSKNIIKKHLSAIIGVFLFIGILSYFSNNSIVGDRLKNSSNTGDLSGRDETWLEMLPIVNVKPYFGIGHNGFDYEVQYIYGESRSAHNVFLTILITSGFAGLILFLFFLFRIIKKATSNYKKNNDILSVVLLVPILVMALVAHLLSTKIEWGIFVYIITITSKNISLNDKNTININ